MATHWRSLKDELVFQDTIIVDLDSQAISSLPEEIRKELKFTPQIFVLYPDSKIEFPKNPIASPEGLKELESWLDKGPPNFINWKSQLLSDPIDHSPEYCIWILTSVDCPICKYWEEGGNLEVLETKLSENFPKIETRHYKLDQKIPPANEEESRRRYSLVGIGVPSLFIVDSKKWKNPVTKKLTRKDIFLFPGIPHSPKCPELLDSWIRKITMPIETMFLGYIILATSPRCGHCVNWAETTKPDFLSYAKNIDGMQLIEVKPSGQGLVTENGNQLKPQIAKSIRGFPMAIFVPAAEFNAENPEVLNLPDPRDMESFDSWVKSYKSGKMAWKSDPSYQAPNFSRKPMRRLQRSKLI